MLVSSEEDKMLVADFIVNELRDRYAEANLDLTTIEKENIKVLAVPHISSNLYHVKSAIPFEDAYFVCLAGKLIWVNEPNTGSGQTRFHYLPDQKVVVFSVIQGSSNLTTKFRVLQTMDGEKENFKISKWIIPEDGPESITWKFFDLNLSEMTIDLVHPMTKKTRRLKFSVAQK